MFSTNLKFRIDFNSRSDFFSIPEAKVTSNTLHCQHQNLDLDLAAVLLLSQFQFTFLLSKGSVDADNSFDSDLSKTNVTCFVGPDDSSVNNALEAFDLSKTKLLKLSFGLKISEDMIAWSVAAENKSSVFLFLTVSSYQFCRGNELTLNNGVTFCEVLPRVTAFESADLTNENCGRLFVCCCCCCCCCCDDVPVMDWKSGLLP